MFLTGILTAGVSFAVYLHGLKTETPELARTHAFALLVFAELLRSFGCRSETRLIWRIPLLLNISLLAITRYRLQQGISETLSTTTEGQNRTTRRSTSPAIK